MNKCKQCGKEIEVVPGKVQRLFCSDAHRKAYKRAELSKSEATASPSVDERRTDDTKLPTSDSLTPDKSTPDSNLGQGVTNPCKYCGKQLDFAILECCSDCALKQPTKVSPAQDGHILASRPALEFTGKLTDFEREHYKPASELKSGQYNIVSKPGDADYNGVCTPEWRAERGR